ncbi:MAG: plasmid pRiA4b ORF-3 family protein [Deltaproteobacteria bacterium]|jgi:hypothetical protein|nr:plasmid pRiA4b ORF-3 family protein [Deltaproteobacteria bacterium]
MAKNSNYYLFRIELKRIKPKIWRRFYASGDTTMASFHEIIKDVMGWFGGHLYQFMIFGNSFSSRDDALIGPTLDFDYEDEDAHKYTINSFKFVKNDTFTYTYDFGDDWQHLIKVLQLNYEPKQPIKHAGWGIVAGARKCPPEDIGGVYGYYSFLEALEARKSGQPSSGDDDSFFEEILEYYDDDYDPEEFNF